MTDPSIPNAFTPGPWHRSEMRMGKKLWESLNNGEPLTIVQANWDGWSGDVIAAVWSDDDTDELANARLIAAAPEMLELLNQCFDTLGGVEYAAELRDRLLTLFAKIGGAA